MNVPEHRPAMPWPEHRPPTFAGLLAYVESPPDPPPTHLPWLRRLLWLAARPFSSPEPPTTRHRMEAPVTDEPRATEGAREGER